MAVKRIRPDWPAYFNAIAEVVSRRATCPRASVGAVIVSANHRILATGYNGAAAGQIHCDDEGCVMEGGHCQRAIHAEVNAVGYAARHGVSLEGSTLYVYADGTAKAGVCLECAKVLSAAGVKF